MNLCAECGIKPGKGSPCPVCRRLVCSRDCQDAHGVKEILAAAAEDGIPFPTACSYCGARAPNAILMEISDGFAETCSLPRHLCCPKTECRAQHSATHKTSDPSRWEVN